MYFGRRNGQKTLGTVIKVMRKNLKVRQDEASGQYRSYPVGTKWTVPPSLCTHAEEGRPSPCLVNVLTGKRTYGRPGESEDTLFGRMANDML